MENIAAEQWSIEKKHSSNTSIPIKSDSSSTPRDKGVLGKLILNRVNASAKRHFPAAAISKPLQRQKGGKTNTLRNGQGSAHSSSLKQLELAWVPHHIKWRTAPSMHSKYQPSGHKALCTANAKSYYIRWSNGREESLNWGSTRL